MYEDHTSFTSRLKRYTQVSTALGGVAVKYAGEHFLGLSIDHQAQAQNLAKALGSLKGPVLKIAQMLATVPDAVPAEYVKEFLPLQSEAPAMGWPFVRRRMIQELGPDWVQKFQHFDPQASFAASLGQVHRAVSLKGETLACKLQYPNMVSIVDADLQQLKLVLNLYEKTFQALKTDSIFEEIRARLLEELDYKREAKHIALYQDILKKFSFVHLPTVDTSLSTTRLLTMKWLEGKKLTQVQDQPFERRNDWARKMFQLWYMPFYHYGFIHADPHLGNYTFQEDGAINLLDFGCIRRFPAKTVQGVIDLYRALQSNNLDGFVHAYESWGFKNLTKEMIEVLNLWARLLYEPLLDDRVRPLQQEFSGLSGRATAFKVHEELKRLGGLEPPREFVFLDRASVGIGSLFLHLKAELNWHQELEGILETYNNQKLAADQQRLITIYDLV